MVKHMTSNRLIYFISLRACWSGIPRQGVPLVDAFINLIIKIPTIRVLL